MRQRLTVASDDTTRSQYSVHEKDDLFSHLPVNVLSDGVDVYDGLSGYFDDVVDFKGKKARMEVSLIDLPPLLQIQLQVGCDYSSIHLILTKYFDRESSSTAKLFSHTNHKHMSNLQRLFTWIDSWLVLIHKRKPVPRP
jgi:hypothetical protein